MGNDLSSYGKGDNKNFVNCNYLSRKEPKLKTFIEEIRNADRRGGDYFMPNFLAREAKDLKIGKYGRLCRNYLKEYRPIEGL